MFCCLTVMNVAFLAAAYQILKLLYQYYIGSFFGLNCDLKTFKGWAIITGCTDGIGKAYAFALAKKGINLIMISRSQEKLDNLAEELNSCGVIIKTIAVDFSHDTSIYNKIEKEIRGLRIGILINNVGMSQYPGYLLDLPDRESMIDDLINVNLVSTMRMTSLILPGMAEQHCGLILNVSSMSMVSPLAGFSMYGGIKSAVDYYTRTLNMEYKHKGIVIQSVVPGYVSTKMSKVKPSFNSPLPAQYVQCHLRTIGLCEKSYGYIVHAISASIFSLLDYLLPDNIRHWIIINGTKNVIKHYKKKAEAFKSQ